MQKKTLVIGASPNLLRFSNRAIKMLLFNCIETIAIGKKNASIGSLIIKTGLPTLNDIHTVTLYLSPKNQICYYNYIISIQPKRVIFNPGSENPEFEELLKLNKIEVLHDCILVMLSKGEY